MYNVKCAIERTYDDFRTKKGWLGKTGCLSEVSILISDRNDGPIDPLMKAKKTMRLLNTVWELCSNVPLRSPRPRLTVCFMCVTRCITISSISYEQSRYQTYCCRCCCCTILAHISLWHIAIETREPMPKKFIQINLLLYSACVYVWFWLYSISDEEVKFIKSFSFFSQ